MPSLGQAQLASSLRLDITPRGFQLQEKQNVLPLVLASFL
jgi:hypothetical protein